MPRGRGHHAYAAWQYGVSPPVVLDDLCGRNPPRREMRAEPEGHVKRHPARAQGADGGLIEVIVVLVRDDHGVEVGERVEGERRWVKSGGPNPTRR